jgi:hypothetical protein
MANGTVDFYSPYAQLAAMLGYWFGQMTFLNFALIGITQSTPTKLTDANEHRGMLVVTNMSATTEIFLGLDDTVSNSKFTKRITGYDADKFDNYRGEIWAYHVVPITLYVCVSEW